MGRDIRGRRMGEPGSLCCTRSIDTKGTNHSRGWKTGRLVWEGFLGVASKLVRK